MRIQAIGTRRVVLTGIVATLSLSAHGANLLLPVQARFEDERINLQQYAPMPGSELAIVSNGPSEGAHCLEVRAQAGAPSCGVHLALSDREFTYRYELTTNAVSKTEYTPFPAGPYTVSCDVRGTGAFNVMMCDQAAKEQRIVSVILSGSWQRVSATVDFKTPPDQILIQVYASTPVFCVDAMQLEPGATATPFAARPIPQARPVIPPAGFMIGKGARVVCLGDSMTDWTPGYVAVFRDRLREKYSDRDIAVVRRGVGGNTFGAMLARVKKDVVAEEPDWVLVNGGLNDVGQKRPLGESQTNLELLVSCLLEQTHAQIVLVGPTPFQGRPDLAPALTAVNDMVAATARKHGLLFVPEEQAIRDGVAQGQKLYFSDPHFNQVGYGLMADTILKALQY